MLMGSSLHNKALNKYYPEGEQAGTLFRVKIEVDGSSLVGLFSADLPTDTFFFFLGLTMHRNKLHERARNEDIGLFLEMQAFIFAKTCFFIISFVGAGTTTCIYYFKRASDDAHLTTGAVPGS